jgi:hypothetical protein
MHQRVHSRKLTLKNSATVRLSSNQWSVEIREALFVKCERWKRQGEGKEGWRLKWKGAESISFLYYINRQLRRKCETSSRNHWYYFQNMRHCLDNH